MDDLDTMSLDDVYNHLKVYELEVQKSAGPNSQNMAFISSSNTNSGKYEVSTVQGVSTTSTQTATTQSNGSQIKYEDITQIDDDDIEEIDIKWNLALLSMRADRFWKKTGKKITIQGSDVAGCDKSKVECFNFHKMGHFARECRSPRSQDRGKKESYKKDPKVEEPAPKAMIAIDGIGWDWSYMAKEDENHALVADEEEVPTEYALMAKSSSSSDNEVYDDSFCSKSCRKNTKNLNNKIIKLNEELILERDLELRDNKIENLRNELEEVKKEKECIDFKIEKFDNASKDLDSLLGNQRLVIDKKGLGFNEYNTVPPPPAQVYSPPKKDMSWMGLPEFVDDTITNYSRPTPSIDVFVKETGCPSVSKVNNTENSRKPTVKYAEMYRNTSQSHKVMSSNFGPPIIEDWDSEDESEVNFTLNKTVRPNIKQVKFDKSTREVVGEKETLKQNKSHPRGNQRNWNNQKSQQLGKDFVMQNKACYNCDSFKHLKFDCKQNTWVNKGKTWTRVDHDHDNMKYTSTPTLDTVKNKVWVPTATTKFPTVGLKVPTTKPTVVAVKGNRGKAVKASACWIWKPKQNQPDQGSNLNGVPGIPQDNINDKGYWDSGCSRHMTSNISYLSKYEPYNGGYVSFRHGGGMITGKGKDFKLVDDTHASEDESMLWHRRLGHLNFKAMNKLVRNNLVKGLPSKSFENNHTCVACLKGKQHRACCKTKLVNSVTKPLHTLHMDLFGPTSVSSLNHKWYCLVVTDDFSRFTWTFFLKSKDETSSIIRSFITEIENLKDLKVKIIRCDNGGEFRNKEMDEFCSRKVDAKLPITFWAEAVNTACYVQNRVLVNKSQHKTPYDLFNGRSPAIGFLRPFRCHVMILNTLDHLGKFDAKGDEGYFVGYSLNSKAFRVFNKRTKKIDENLHVDFLENQPIEKGTGPNWLFNIDSLTKLMNYVPVVVAGTSSTNILGTKKDDLKENVSSLSYIALPNWFHEAQMVTSNDSTRNRDAFSEKGDPQNEQDKIISDADVSESSGNTNPTVITKDPTAEQV
ncbi:putative ribonuclease H-like domain-containing protein [Tanacetum coccineum]|uniref:Ribonuclease H-like domain-containing protein n=1 Tax=Tanacetum coccineum TaxID=301880 RepID=A0ABQ5DK43_9ASTR